MAIWRTTWVAIDARVAGSIVLSINRTPSSTFLCMRRPTYQPSITHPTRIQS
jgi:hypothetical protein